MLNLGNLRAKGAPARKRILTRSQSMLTRGTSIIVIFCCITAVPAFCWHKDQPERWPSSRGTINVVVANDQGIVILTDSMLTIIDQDDHGRLTSRQDPSPGQKLFRIDDRTVVAFAGFASADTPPLPGFLNNVSTIMGRYQDKLGRFDSLSFSDKLELLAEIFTHYLSGTANLREGVPGADYRIQLLLVGYDRDRTAEVGRLVLGPQQDAAALYSESVVQERQIFRVTHRQLLCVDGIKDVATQILRDSNSWRQDPISVAEPDPACWEAQDGQRFLTVKEMRDLAISLKQRTADRHSEVGGPNQVAVLMDGRIQGPIDQPSFPAVPISGFKFEIVANMNADGNLAAGDPKVYKYGVVVSGLFTLYFRNQFIHVRQLIGDAYYANNSFRDCILMYSGGETHLEKSNLVADSDLEVASGVPRDSRVVKQLLHDFKWRSVRYGVPMRQKTQSRAGWPGSFFCVEPIRLILFRPAESECQISEALSVPRAIAPWVHRPTPRTSYITRARFSSSYCRTGRAHPAISTRPAASRAALGETP
jgi:hypothetical protein